MTSGGELVGRVRTAAGEPVANADLSASTVGGDPRDQQARAYDTSKADGTFRLRALVAGTYEVDCNTDAYPSPAPKPRATVALGATANLEIILAAGGALDGVVVDTHGKGVSGARVWFRGEKFRNKSTRSGDDGAFHLAGVTPTGHH